MKKSKEEKQLKMKNIREEKMNKEKIQLKNNIDCQKNKEEKMKNKESKNNKKKNNGE